jgi:hypothetical protein
LCVLFLVVAKLRQSNSPKLTRCAQRSATRVIEKRVRAPSNSNLLRTQTAWGHMRIVRLWRFAYKYNPPPPPFFFFHQKLRLIRHFASYPIVSNKKKKVFYFLTFIFAHKKFPQKKNVQVACTNGAHFFLRCRRIPTTKVNSKLQENLLNHGKRRAPPFLFFFFPLTSKSLLSGIIKNERHQDPKSPASRPKESEIVKIKDPSTADERTQAISNKVARTRRRKRRLGSCLILSRHKISEVASLVPASPRGTAGRCRHLFSICRHQLHLIPTRSQGIP